MNLVENRFDHNTSIAISTAKYECTLIKHKELSDIALPRMLTDDKRNYFDFIYINGTHKAPAVLFDAVTAFRLTKIGGAILLLTIACSLKNYPMEKIYSDALSQQ